MATFITSKSIGETISISVQTSTGYWKYNHDGADSSVFENGEQIITITNVNGEFTLISCDSEGNVSGDITYLDLKNNQLTSFDGTGLTALTDLELEGNQLISFNGTGLTALTYLGLGNNSLTSLNNFTFPSSLTNLNLYTNQLTAFDGAGLINLNYLDLSDNQLTLFNGTDLNVLQNLYIINNFLTPSINNSLLAQLAANELANSWGYGTFQTTGGRTSAGTADYDYLIANSWDVQGADLIPTGTGKLRVKGTGQL